LGEALHRLPGEDGAGIAAIISKFPSSVGKTARVTATYIPSLIKTKRRVDFCRSGGQDLIQRNDGVQVCLAGHGAGWGWLAEISDALVSVVFPSGHICEGLLTTASHVPLCQECLSSFKRVPNIICEVCGRPLPGLARKEGETLLCPLCQEKTYAFDRARSFAVYEDAVVKFEQIEPLGRGFRNG
jgi:hypothetical protein